MQGLWLFQELRLAASLEGEASSLHSSSLPWEKLCHSYTYVDIIYIWEHLK